MIRVEKKDSPVLRRELFVCPAHLYQTDDLLICITCSLNWHLRRFLGGAMKPTGKSFVVVRQSLTMNEDGSLLFTGNLKELQILGSSEENLELNL